MSGNIEIKILSLKELIVSKYEEINKEEFEINTDNSENNNKSSFSLPKYSPIKFYNKMKNKYKKTEKKEPKSYFMCTENKKPIDQFQAFTFKYDSNVNASNSTGYGSENFTIHLSDLFICDITYTVQIPVKIGSFMSISPAAKNFLGFFQQKTYYKFVNNFPATFNLNGSITLQPKFKIVSIERKFYKFNEDMDNQFGMDSMNNLGKKNNQLLEIKEEEDLELDEEDNLDDFVMNNTDNPWENISEEEYNKLSENTYGMLADPNFQETLQNNVINDDGNDTNENNSTLERKLQLNKIFKEIKSLVDDSSVISKMKNLI
jgi:hypothetical protein